MISIAKLLVLTHLLMLKETEEYVNVAAISGFWGKSNLESRFKPKSNRLFTQSEKMVFFQVMPLRNVPDT